ncbi:Arabinose operon regulatory protein [Paenibacillus solanacearum]|uniref:Arabinose operon regulatory protein n=1 Tax=Paenibacillus solanacearum TaxID=2048548 RepID=A0A916JWN6_9BACL|nr:AraC family transcriptional regulator [Paenibacillus solanacearum]CAG7606228.1 Arabinose operon regulatory protein [Paenibacillus solanacearum]
MKVSPVFQNFRLDRKPYKLHSYDKTYGEGAIWDKNHAHQGMEFVYLQQGEGIVIIDHNIMPIKPGTIMFFQPFQLHRIKIHSSETGYYIRSKILFEPEIFYPIFQHFPVLQKFFVMLWKEQLTTQVIDHSHQRDALDRLFEEFKPNHDLPAEEQQERFSLLLIQFLQLIKNTWKPVKHTTSEAPRTLSHAEKAFQWIETHFREPFDLGQMASALFLTPQHISRLFRNTTGSTISEYLLSRRLREACLLICTTELPIQEIAMHVGIPHVSRFCQVFKRRIGMTPLQYRAANKATTP